MSILSAPHFHNEEAAFERLEAIVWPNGPVCPKCGNCEGSRITRVTGATARTGLRRCLECKKQFTVKVGTVFESAHVPLHKWFQAAHLLASSKKGISAHQLHRTLQVTYKTAWFMAHRLRYDDAIFAVGRKVDVFGTLRYRARSDFPHQIEVSSIEAHPPESELPDWDDLRGRAPDATGTLTSEAFVRELRDGWR